MHSDARTLLETRGIPCHPLHMGNPATLTTGRTLDHVAGIYDMLEPLMMMGMDRAITRDVIRYLASKGGNKVLDVGCGTGTLTRAIAGELLSRKESCVVGVDAATAMIKVARGKARGLSNIAFEAALAERLPFGEASFDRAVSTMFFHHISQDLKIRALDEIWRTLKPGGSAIVVDVAKPTTWFGTVCAWSGYVLFQQAEIRENIEGKLENAFDESLFKTWRQLAHYGGYISAYELER